MTIYIGSYEGGKGMNYYKTNQPVPGKGYAWMYYECADDNSVIRYVTHIPSTGEVQRVPDPVVKTLYRPETLQDSSQKEFETYWGDHGDLQGGTS